MSFEFPADLHWVVVRELTVPQLIATRLVSRLWCDFVDMASQADWRTIYIRRVCDCLCVSDDYDWRRACMSAFSTSTHKRLDVMCMWKQRRLRILAPWLEERDSTRLRDGVVRLTMLPQRVDFVYDDAFRLRGCARSCMQRQAEVVCHNCNKPWIKQRCLNPRYEYYLREIHPLWRIKGSDGHGLCTLDEALAHWLRV